MLRHSVVINEHNMNCTERDTADAIVEKPGSMQLCEVMDDEVLRRLRDVERTGRGSVQDTSKDELRKFMKNLSLGCQSVRNRHLPNKRQNLCCLNQISQSVRRSSRPNRKINLIPSIVK
jgi:hypothetical protein